MTEQHTKVNLFLIMTFGHYTEVKWADAESVSASRSAQSGQASAVAPPTLSPKGPEGSHKETKVDPGPIPEGLRQGGDGENKFNLGKTSFVDSVDKHERFLNFHQADRIIQIGHPWISYQLPFGRISAM